MTKDEAINICLDALKVHEDGSDEWFEVYDNVETLKNSTPPFKEHKIKFEEVVVRYPPKELCPYPEYTGKPYFSIRYEENGEYIIGFGTYNPEVLSRYLREYFITPPLPKHHGRLIDVDELYENTEICHSDIDGYACVRWKDINDAPTIIEADTEGEE